MHLREVHMENFKTFQRKLVVPFEPGFTAITGPNGSGKSNIGDAIMFVLGPNSPRAMRAKNLSDLIFNGGAGGKPADHCTVSLVFDNADRTMPVDADTVTLTRRVKLTPKDDDPDGYSSYFYVNGRASQKKEFIDLLNHARISADGYNITLQGDVTNICNMTPQKRREILDDISGVAAFDKDIAAADLRKSDVAANLDRIGVVLAEIEGRLQQLDKDKGAALKWRDLNEAIKRLKGLMAHRRRDDLGAQLTQLKAQVAQFTAEREKTAQSLNELRAKQTEAQARFAEAEQKIRQEGGEEAQKLQERLTLAHAEMTRYEEKINFAKAEAATAKEAVAPIQEELRKLDKAIDADTKAREAAARDHAATEAELKKAKSELDAIRAAISSSDKGAARLNMELGQLKVEHEAKQTELHEVRLEADRAAERLASIQAAVAAAASALASTATDHEEATFQLKDLKANAGGAGKKRKDAEKRLFELRKQQAEFAKQAEDLELRTTRLSRELAELRAGEEAAARAQGGHGRAVQEVLAARKDIKGIIGTPIELAKVEKRFQEALQIAGGARLQAVLVEDDAVAAQCIEMVKRNRSGRATFLPLNKMVPGRPSGQALMAVKKEGCLGFAMDLIEYNPRYQNAFWHVFQDTLIVDTMQNARRMMGGVRIVTLDGELFEKSGAMTGGKDSKKDNDVQFTNADRGRMDEILAELGKAESAQEDAMARAAAAAQAVVELNTEMAALGASDASAEDRVRELERKVEWLDARLVELRAAHKQAGHDATKTEAAVAELGARAATLEARLTELDVLRQEKGKTLLRGSAKEQRDAVERLEAAVTDLTDRLLKAAAARDLAGRQLELLAARRAEVQAQLGERGQAGTRHADDIERYTKAHTKAQAEVEALLKMQKKATGAVKGLQDARDKLYKDLTDLKARMDKLADRMDTHFSLITNANAKVPALEDALADAMVELQENPVKLAPDEAVPPMDDLKRELRSTEVALERLGPVNLRALDDYEAESKRRTELRDEVTRLQSQREELVQLVAAISTRKKDAFMGVFGRINENFGTVYKELSLGGQAYMELEDEDDPFAGGLILKAQPPGKKVLRIDALSGGEKSLTSMAFIFAIQRDDPSPFYYFDEVDQNLDAVNSELLAKMIRANAQYAQFIVVSLRKITLKEASHIYGVTQTTPGQSEIIAHFDIDTMRGEEPKKGGEGGEGGSVMDGHDGEDGGATVPQLVKKATKKAQKASAKAMEAGGETTIQSLMQRAVHVEVKP